MTVMPGYVVHLAVAEEYLKKHPNSEKYEEFINGVIFPDSVKDKSLTHYGSGSSEVNLVDFLKDKKLDNSFNRGYFLHLYTDYLFYNKYIDTFSDDIYNDYDLTNGLLIKKYNLTLPESVKKYVFFKTEGECRILTMELASTVIDELSEDSIDDIERDIKQNPQKWMEHRKMKKI